MELFDDAGIPRWPNLKSPALGLIDIVRAHLGLSSSRATQASARTGLSGQSAASREAVDRTSDHGSFKSASSPPVE